MTPPTILQMHVPTSQTTKRSKLINEDDGGNDGDGEDGGNEDEDEEEDDDDEGRKADAGSMDASRPDQVC
jgi:hypothetical protein